MDNIFWILRNDVESVLKSYTYVGAFMQHLDNQQEEAAGLSEQEDGFGEHGDDYGFEP